MHTRWSVVSGALIEARRLRADLLVVNRSDRSWNVAFERAGMLSWKRNQIFSLSAEIEARFRPIEDYARRFLFTCGDGHGPTRLWWDDEPS